jgi:ABC-type branched-subunit amino acid transport system ATPase component/ABC-type branched-subunit amino acid transport system permease subunit
VERRLGAPKHRSTPAPIQSGSRGWWIGWPLTVLLAAFLPIVLNDSAQLLSYESIAITLLVVLGLNLSFGYAGELSFGQPVIMGSSAYMAGVLSSVEHWSAFETLPAALAVGVVTSLVINSVSLRLKGWYLAVTTLFAVAVFPDLLNVFEFWTQSDNGLGNIQPIPGMNLSVTGNSIREFEFVLLVAAVTWLALRNLQVSRWGVLLRALRDCRNGLVSCGGDEIRIRLAVTIVAAIPVSLGGWLFAHINMYLVPQSFGLDELLLIVGAVVIGGRGTVWGPVIGTLVFEVISLWIGPFSTVNELVLGAAVLVVSAIIPLGLARVGRDLPIPGWNRRRTRRTVEQVSDLLPPIVSRDSDTTRSSTEDGILSPLLSTGRDASADVASIGLRVDDVSKSFAGLVALESVSMEFRAGEITGLIGPNGSGKTTLLNVITGFIKPDVGTIMLGDGADISGMRPHKVARAGIRRSFQTPQLIGELTVEENIALGRIGVMPQRVVSAIFQGPSYRRLTRELAESVSEICHVLDLVRFADVRIEELPLGLRRIVEIGRAMISHPKVICLDEPAAGLGEHELEALRVVLQDLKKRQYSVLLIEHNLEFVNEVCDRVVALDHGKVVDRKEGLDVAVRDMSYSGAVSSRHVGGAGRSPSVASTLREGQETQVQRAALETEGLSAWYGQAQALFDVSIRVGDNEILGILGDNGAGKSTLLKSIARVHGKVEGSIRLQGTELLSKGSSKSAVLGVSLVREGARVFPNLTILEHLAFSKYLAGRRGKEYQGDELAWEWLPFLYERRSQKAGVLSGGQRQLLALTAAAMSEPTCLLLDEPSAGLAESISEVVFDSIRRIASQGGTLIIAEQSDRWLSGLVDQVCTLELGKVQWRGSAGSPNDPE